MKLFTTKNGARVAFDLMDNLLENFPKSDSMASAGSSPHRLKQLKCGNALVKQLIGPDELIKHDENGRPHLRSRKRKISITHTKNHIACIAANYQVAIDMELADRDVTRIMHKFISEYEIERHLKLPIQNITLLIWTVKECLFKAMQSSHVDFKKHLHIDEIEIGEEEILSRCSILHSKIQGSVLAKSIIFEAHLLTYIDTPINIDEHAL